MRRHLPEYACELAGTAIMLFIGVSAVTLFWADGSPLPAIPWFRLRLLATGLVFAGGATMVVYSPLGQRSGGHLNPAVTLAFWRMGKVPGRDALAYAAAQFLGAGLGVLLAALAWGEPGRSVRLAATTPGAGVPAALAFGAEILITFALVFLVLVCLHRPRIAPRTGLLAGSLVATLVMLEAPISGTSLNPARSLGPASLMPLFDSFWIYLTAPPLGALLAVVAFRQRWGHRVPLCAKLYHTEKHRCIFPDCGYDLVAAGQTVMHEGERGDTAYVVDRGRLQVRTARPDGGDAVVAELGPGEWVGEMSLLLDEPRSATVVALTDAQLRPFTRESFGRILVEDPDRAQALMRQLAARLRDANRRLAG